MSSLPTRLEHRRKPGSIASSVPGLGRHRSRGSGRAVAIAGLLGTLAGLGAVRDPLATAGLAVLALLVVTVLRWPGLGFVVLLAVIAALGTSFGAPGGGPAIRAVDVLALALVAAALVHRLMHQSDASLGAPLVALAVIAVLAAYGLVRNELASVRTDLSLLFFFPVGFVAIRQLLNRFDRRMAHLAILGSAALAAAKALYLGFFPRPLNGAASFWQAWSFVTSTGWRVILVGGDAVLLVAPAYLAAVYGTTRRGWRRALVVAIAAIAATAVSKTRTTLILATFGFALGLIVHAWISDGPAGGIGRLARQCAGAICITAIVGLLIPAQSNTFVSSATVRFDAQATGPLGSPSTSLAVRSVETRDALETLRGSDLLVGRGLGASYFDPLLRKPTTWSHNALVWVLLKIGVIGIALLLIVAFGGMRRVLGRLRSTDVESRRENAAWVLVVVMLGCASLWINPIASVEGMFLLGAASGWLATSGRGSR